MRLGSCNVTKSCNTVGAYCCCDLRYGLHSPAECKEVNQGGRRARLVFFAFECALLTTSQDILDLRDDLAPEEQGYQQHYDDRRYTSDEEHSVMEDDDEHDGDGEFLEDDDRSSVSEIPDPSIDFDLVYSLHAFVATVEGQANVAKGDSLFLMDDSNSYWWLVRVLKSQEVGYIPAENIETPHERLARLNKHRNVDVCHFYHYP